MTLKIPFDNSYRRLGDSFYFEASPTAVSNPHLISWNSELAEELKIEFLSEKSSPELLAEYFSGNQILSGSEPLAQAYSGHQFGHFVPVLGDGRAILLGEVVGQSGRRWDIQLKGAGPTLFSRGGDGRSALGPVLREYLVSEFMNRVGIPTTRALAACTTGDFVWRHEPLPGAVLTRVAESHIRVGSFEYFAAKKDIASLASLLKYLVERHYPDLRSFLDSADLPFLFLRALIDRQASLVVQWMSLGFIHGVMNTDNSSAIGITIDYGPCAFMDEFLSSKVFSSIDRHGRYAYSQQGKIALWNLGALAEALLPIFESNGNEALQKAAERFRSELDRFPIAFEETYYSLFSKKLGLSTAQPELVKLWMNYLEKNSLDFTLSFRKLPELLGAKASFFPDSKELNDFFVAWRQALGNLETTETLSARINSINPIYIPRNHQIEKVIQSALRGDFKDFHTLREVLENPFIEKSDYQDFAKAPDLHERVSKTFCGT